MTIQEIFDALRNGSEADKEAAKAFVRRPENLYRLTTSAEFVQAVVANADLFPIFCDEYDIDGGDMDAPPMEVTVPLTDNPYILNPNKPAADFTPPRTTECPHCGQPLNW